MDYVVVPHTHWDREWYLSFQQFRWKLVKVVDEVLETLERDEAFSHFMLDGQTVVVEDYLELRPDRRAKIARFVQEGRLSVGPWYVQPDDLLVSGEALVRNLERGLHLANELGGAMMVGYLPDSFGHAGSLPAILRSFGIDSACLMRGPGRELDKVLFGWTAKDGHRVIVANLVDGYGNGADLPADAEAIGEALQAAREKQREALIPGVPLLVLNGFDHRPINTALAGALSGAGLTARNGGAARIAPLRAYFDAVSSVPLGALPEWHGELRSVYRCPINAGCTSSRHWIKSEDQAISTLLERGAEPLAVLASLVGADYPERAIELAWKHLLLNQPHDSICGCSIDAAHEDMKYRYAQARGLARGVIADAQAALVRSVDTAFAAPDLAVVALNAAPRRIARAIELEMPDVPVGAALRDADGSLHAIQVEAASGEPSLFFDERLSPTQIRMALGLVRHGELMSFRIHDAKAAWEADGVLGVELKLSEGSGTSSFDWDAWVERVAPLLRDDRLRSVHAVGLRSGPKRVLFSATLPSFGGAAFALRPPRPGEPVLTDGDLRAGRREIENERYRVRVVRGGAIELCDKRSRVTYHDVGRLVDEGDRGDEYNFDALPGDRVVSRPSRRRRSATRYSVRLVEAGPVRATLRVDAEYRVPEELARDRSRRGRPFVALQTSRWISLCGGSARVELRIEIANRARDHRLRMHVPLPGRCAQSEAGGTFEIVERPARPAAPPPGEPLYGEASDLNYEEPPSTHPFSGFVGARWSDAEGRSGAVAVLARGAREYEIVERGGRSEIAVTLFRSVGWLSRADLSSRRGQAGPDLPTPAAQVPGVWSFDLALVGYDGPVAASEVPGEWEDFRSPAIAASAKPSAGPLGVSPSLLDVQGDGYLFSSLRRLSNGNIAARLYDTLGMREDRTAASDPRGSGRCALLRFGFPVAAAWKTRLDGTRLTELPLDGDRRGIEVPVSPFEIVTVELEPAPLPFRSTHERSALS